jgi:peroxiredoxin
MPPPSNRAMTPQVLHLAPEFELPDSAGKNRRLSELTSDGPLVLLFYRGHW